MPIVAGNPEFTQQITAHFPDFFNAPPALKEALNQIVNSEYSALTAEQHLILNLGIVAGTTLAELILLAVNGFGPGAQRAARSLLEIVVIAEYLRINPDEYEHFREWVHIARYAPRTCSNTTRGANLQPIGGAAMATQQAIGPVPPEMISTFAVGLPSTTGIIYGQLFGGMSSPLMIVLMSLPV